MKYIIPFANPEVYHDNIQYLKTWFRSEKTYFDNKLAADGVVFVKDILEDFCFKIGGCDPEFLSLKWVSPLRSGYRYKHDRRYKVKIYLKRKGRSNFSHKYDLVIDVYDPSWEANPNRFYNGRSIKYGS